MNKGKKSFLLYFFSLMLVEMPIMWFARGLPSGIFIAIMLGGAVGHFLLFVVAGAILNGVINKKFEEEYNPILEAYQQDKDAQKLLESLQNMKNKPRSLMMHNAYNFTLSTAYYELGDKYGALTALNNINTADGRLAAEINKQRDKISKLSEE